MSLLYIQGESERQRHIHYEVDTSVPPLGEGGMGQVFRGLMVNEANGVKKDVAIKFLFEDLPGHAIERAKREASIQIHNENLVEMFGFIETTDNNLRRYHVVSELLDGVMLFDVLNGKTSDKFGKEVDFAKELYTMYMNDKFAFACYLSKNILSGLMALHDKGYIHRDLDPSNIMITSDRKIKIIDFGIAKQLNTLNTQDQQLTSTGQFVGKAAYAAPELVLGDVKSQNQTTDIYAVGIMLYQFLTGQLPFNGTMAEVIKKQINDKIPLKIISNKAIRSIIIKATDKKQINRYQSAAEMRVAIEHLQTKPSQQKTIDVVLTKKPSLMKYAIGIVSVVALICVMFLVNSTGNNSLSQEELAKNLKDSLFKARNGVVVDSPERTYIIDAESGAQMVPVGILVAQAIDELDDTTTVRTGIAKLQNIIQKYSNYKYSAEAAYILAALAQPEDATVSSVYIQDLRKKTSGFIKRDASIAHKSAQKAVDLNPQCYQAIFELGTDYAVGELRTGVVNDIPDFDKALELYQKGIALAKESKDSIYITLFNTRIDQIMPFIDKGVSK